MDDALVVVVFIFGVFVGTYLTFRFLKMNPAWLAVDLSNPKPPKEPLR